jgi:hypothetical protein
VIILPYVRWYLRYSLSYRDLEEMMAERGLAVGLLAPELANGITRVKGVASKGIRDDPR